MKKWLLIYLFIPTLIFGQTYNSPHFGVSVGLLVNVGSHVNSLGIALNTYYSAYFCQLNAGTTLTLNATGYGGRKHFVESRNAVGLVLLAGKKQQTPDFQLNGLLHNTSYNYGIAYNYIWYLDNAGTSQRSGGWGLHIKKFNILIENDVFGGQAKDRFRTGHLTFNYRLNTIKFTTGLYIWTGETANSIWQKVPLDKCPSGFRLLEDLPYGGTSHGIFYGGISAQLPFGQFATARIGIDSEQIRHAFQNRLIHDLIFLPRSFDRNTPHYPRLDENGCAVFDTDSVRNSKFYFQTGLNENWSN